MQLGSTVESQLYQDQKFAEVWLAKFPARENPRRPRPR
jgi:hypothetical protein